MGELRYTLVADGPTDDALLPMLNWLLAEHLPEWSIQAQHADWWRLPQRRQGLREHLEKGLELYPCDLLFVHRDAEREPLENRVDEITRAVLELRNWPRYVCVVPVRMTEAWFLFNEAAIRRAAGNPNGRQELDLPPLRKVEELPDPKRTLRQLLELASGLKGRRLHNLKATPRRVADFIDDFSPLRTLPASQRVEMEIQTIAAELNHPQDIQPNF